MKKVAPYSTGTVLPGASKPLSTNVALNSGVDGAKCLVNVTCQRARTGHNCEQNRSENQRVFEQILTRLFTMQVANELCERHAKSPSSIFYLLNLALNSDVDRAKCLVNVSCERARTGYNCEQNRSQNQRVFEQILTRLFTMQVANELTERHATSSSSNLNLVNVAINKTLIFYSKHLILVRDTAVASPSLEPNR